ncbi:MULTISPECIES: maleylpyruvate isomerase family mycothiol-dependent enzyme [unclassified Isoptericola]|uniref:maleylpyruvate isomerase family mycothiol-dependent enzyme n=1 Tax=unclassified Isoptericola TaxID=2623355 RepID=UPI002713DC14|nr:MULTISPECIES: maleylpyruvate isomerase family mycothiol-dependent enzyme [unclassified Isoptericola]MDO8144508.1 maleylpyruvate isomerase family mycothiol-dependent enzyme [Isoptericola sp. 178]MDO8148361.1 maleylpyruvate isomerase family mycothiol-dependent enzyme [Isoptericola sp. b515]MDO8151842.1 maleylpyruvate isomerase family mycothiol-dependent enzyme [Isoptericola sp. b408]
MTTHHERLWALVHTERSALADDLAEVDDAQWRARSLCSDWTVEDVVAHLVAGASLGRWAWLRSMVGAGLDPDRHNARRLAEHRGSTPAETLARFRAVTASTVAPSRDVGAWLGEVVVHGEDVRRPLGLVGGPSVESAVEVAQFFVTKDAAVDSRSVARGLELVATDSPFRHGDGPVVRGTTLALVMAMAGRAAFLDELDGAGVELMGDRTRAA